MRGAAELESGPTQGFELKIKISTHFSNYMNLYTVSAPHYCSVVVGETLTFDFVENKC